MTDTHAAQITEKPQGYPCACAYRRLDLLVPRHIPRRGRDSISLLASALGRRAHPRAHTLARALPGMPVTRVQQLRDPRTPHASAYVQPCLPRPCGPRDRPGRAVRMYMPIKHHAKPGFAIAWTAMVDPQSAARPATMRSSGLFCAVVRSCRRPPFRRRAPRAGQQRISTTPHTLFAAR